MRTTVNIDDQLLAQAKKLAQARHQSLGEILAEGLQAVLFHPAAGGQKKPARLITFAGKGTCAGVDLDSNCALLDLTEGR